MRTCKLPECKKQFEPTAPHQKYDKPQCRFRHHQVMRQRIIRKARKQDAKAS